MLVQTASKEEIKSMAFHTLARYLKLVSRRSKTDHRRGHTPRRDKRPRRLLVETLEDRTVLSPVYWTNSAGGDWDTPGNWSTGLVPGVGDDAVINLGGITITHSVASSDTANSLTIGTGLDDTLAISTGSLALASDSALNDNTLTLSGGTLSSAGNLTVSGPFTWTGGTLTGTGSMTASGTTTISGSNAKTLDALTLNLNATTNWTGGIVFVGNNAAINNNGTFNAQTDSSITVEPGAPVATFNNNGTFNRPNGIAGQTRFNTAFNNASSGTVNIQSGTLWLYCALDPAGGR
jgi:hypothetical protein